MTAEQLAHKIADLFPSPHTDQKIFEMVLPVCEEAMSGITEAISAIDDFNLHYDWLMSTAPGTHITVPTEKLRRLKRAMEKLR